jgi:benzoyl-CoA 2,3-dioxygenase component A
MNALVQHLIDPAVCIRCNTCEATCPVGAVTHDSDNYVVDAEICNFCMDCVPPCPTGSINHFVRVPRRYSLGEQFSWLDLPEDAHAAQNGVGGALEAVDEEAAALIADAHGGLGSKERAPASAAEPRINLYDRRRPAKARVTANFRLTDATASCDLRHIILDLGVSPFPVLEGQTIGVAPPGTDGRGRPYAMRLYSVASPRDGERPNTNNLALTVKRVVEPHSGGTHFGVASNYLCDLKPNDGVDVVGPFGATFLMPDDPSADIIMICTGTGSAPFRGFTERRRRSMPRAKGKLYLFFGARRPSELPYFGPLQRISTTLLDQELVFSRLPDRPKEYVQDRMRQRAADLAELLQCGMTHVYVCGLRSMEAGVEAAFQDICENNGLDWSAIRGRMGDEGRYHVETY